MSSTLQRVSLLALLFSLSCAGTGDSAAQAALVAHAGQPLREYPPAAREDLTEILHGVSVADPYRWLEDSESFQTKAWIQAQTELTATYLNSIGVREKLQTRLTQLWNYERWSLPEALGGRLFYRRNDGLANQSILMVQDTPSSLPRVLLDPNTLSRDGTVALAGTQPSSDGRLLAYALADGGSDWNVWRVRDVRSARDLSDELRWVKFTRPAWTIDGAGFFYGRYDEPAPGAELSQANFGQKLYYHRIGTAQAEDQLVYARADQPKWSFQPTVSDDGRFLFVHVTQGTDPKNRLYTMELEGGVFPRAGTSAVQALHMVELIADADASYQVVGSLGSKLFVFTDLEAPRGRVVEIDAASPERSAWRTLIQQGEEAAESVDFVGGRFFVRLLASASSRVRSFDVDGSPLGEVSLPGVCSVDGFQGRQDDLDLYYTVTSFATPGEVWRYSLASKKSELVFRPRLAFDPQRFETCQVFAPSKDGTPVPIFLTWDKRFKPKNKRQAQRLLLYGYGGFGVSLTPSFQPMRLVWMEQGGIFAQANLRGGGEFGEEWHLAGTLDKKQNVFDDFTSAAEFLIREGYTSEKKLSIKGGSNGGLLVAACMLQRPELFGAVVPDVGVLDMLRYHKFTIGWAWTSDYGSPDDPAMFEVLRKYSPYHNVQVGLRYPATLVTTGDHDDRVVPLHSFKFAAALQHAQAGPAPTLIRIETRAGHGAGKPTSKQIEAAADEMAFLLANT